MSLRISSSVLIRINYCGFECAVSLCFCFYGFMLSLTQFIILWLNFWILLFESLGFPLHFRHRHGTVSRLAWLISKYGQLVMQLWCSLSVVYLSIVDCMHLSLFTWALSCMLSFIFTCLSLLFVLMPSSFINFQFQSNFTFRWFADSSLLINLVTFRKLGYWHSISK